ncbi:CHASE2 domain-containing serine/threonine-protein kinase [Acidovorax temperans]|nr:serine/threonine-protein kinase [Acidovorax temperans]WCT24531.1 serine/threonine-protein kinase [Acidovorax temperans]
MARKLPERRAEPRRWTGWISAATALALTGGLWLAGVLPQAQQILYDTAVAHASPGAMSEAVLVDIDARSLAAAGGNWTYDNHAALIDRLAQVGASTVVYAVPLDPPATPTDAQALVSSIAQAQNVIWPAVFADKGPAASLPPAFYRSTLAALGGRGPAMVPVQMGPFAEAAAGVGHLQWRADSDGILRQVPLVLSHDNVGVPALALLAAQRVLHLSAEDISWRGGSSSPGLLLGSLAVGVDAGAVMRPVFGAALPRLAAADVVANKVPPAALRDKTVVVGMTAGPQAAVWTVPGGSSLHTSDVVAQTLVGLRVARSVTAPNWAHTLAWGAVVAMALVVVALPGLRTRAAWGVALGLATLLLAMQWWWLQRALHMVPLVAAAAVVLWGQLLCSIWAALPKRTPGEVPQGSADAERMMALALHGRGELLQAFERFKLLPTSDALKENLYHLGKDFERKKDFALAKKVFKHLVHRDAEYKDARARYRHAKTHLLAQAGISPGHGAGSSFGEGASSLPAAVQETLPRQKASGAFAHYELKHELGKGAMGVVYQGRDLRSGRMVAIKTLALHQEFEGAALVDARERFFKEAEAAGRLEHPNIVTIDGSGEAQGLAYIAMEFVAGTDLTAFTQTPHLLPVAQVLAIGARVASALDYAHAHHVVHRDVKPANIMWDPATDTVKVMDFGVARITDASKTRTGIVLGTPSFMSPEQLCGAKVDGRTDLYALGVTLFQLLTGALPLRAESMPELMHKIVHVPAPDVRTLRPDLPEAVAALVAKALNKRPEDRYQTGAQLAQALTHAMDNALQQSIGEVTAAVVYDPDRPPAEQNMLLTKTTVLEHPQQQSPASRPVAAPVG